MKCIGFDPDSGKAELFAAAELQVGVHRDTGLDQRCECRRKVAHAIEAALDMSGSRTSLPIAFEMDFE